MIALMGYGHNIAPRRRADSKSVARLERSETRGAMDRRAREGDARAFLSLTCEANEIVRPIGGDPHDRGRTRGLPRPCSAFARHDPSDLQKKVHNGSFATDALIGIISQCQELA